MHLYELSRGRRMNVSERMTNTMTNTMDKTTRMKARTNNYK